MRLALLPILLMACSAAFAGCSTDDDLDGSGGGANAPEPYYADQTNCVLMTEDAACGALMDAIVSQLGDLKCTPKTMPACPEFLRQSLPNKEPGLMWDQGTVEECVRFYESFDNCEQFETRPCIVRYYPKGVPTGCPEPDAGAEAASEDGAVSQEAATDGGVQDDAAPAVDVVTPEDAAEDVVVQEDAEPKQDASDDDAAAQDAQAD